MNNYYTLVIATLFCFISTDVLAQASTKENISKAVTDYFFLERENIHVQLNKDIYITNEEVSFKGYVFHRKKNIPFFNTVNVFANLIDESGNILETKLLYGNIGSFIGSFKLNETYKSGRYFLQFYTNWMNNFTEDESAVYEFVLINPATGAGNALAKADHTNINIELFPEGGSFINGIKNISGIRISDCNHEQLPVTAVNITDAGGKVLKQVQINKLGYGRFDIAPIQGEQYKVSATLEGTTHEQVFAGAQQGIALELNEFPAEGKYVLSVRAREAFASKAIYALVHKDDKAILYSAEPGNKTEIKFIINKTDVFSGLNTIRIIDSNMQEIAQRLFFNTFNDKTESKFSPSAHNVNETDFLGTVNYPNMNLSVSVLPQDTKSYNNANDIYGSFLLLPYIDASEKANGRYYFTNATKNKMYELDLYLLAQKSKYKWENIISSPPKSNNTFDMGLTLKGMLPSPGKDDKNASIRLYSLTSGLDETVQVDEKSTFTFNNLVMPDSTYVNFTLLRKGQKPKELLLAPQLLNNNRKYNKPYKPAVRCYVQGEATAASDMLPKFHKETIQLEEVQIEKKRLKYATSFGNTNLTGYKITEMKANTYQTVFQFIQTYGTFKATDREGKVTIYSRIINSINAAQTGPIVYIDNVQLLDYSLLTLIQLSEVDEIYMNAHAIIPSVRNYQGAIKIYLNKGARINRKGNVTPDIIVKGGYEKVQPFHNALYDSTTDEGFTSFGVIDWQSQIMTDEQGNFKLKIPNNNQKSVKIILEGFSADGKLISEVKTLEIEK